MKSETVYKRSSAASDGDCGPLETNEDWEWVGLGGDLRFGGRK